jgi:hypothetical protein
MEATMTTPDQQNQQKQDSAQPQGSQGAEQRSENLLPTDGGDDGQFNVAEEVSLDQQGDMARRVGQAPKGIASEALADTLSDGKAGDKPTS